MNYMPDPYRNCEDDCPHTGLARGVTLDDLQHPGPYPDSNPLMSTGPIATRILAMLRADMPRTING